MVIQPNPNLFYRRFVILGRPPTAPRPADAGLADPAKIFKFFLMGACKLFFQIMKKFLRDCLSATGRRRSRYARNRRLTKIPSPFKPLPFCPPARTAENFLAAAGRNSIFTKRRRPAVFSELSDFPLASVEHPPYQELEQPEHPGSSQPSSSVAPCGQRPRSSLQGAHSRSSSSSSCSSSKSDRGGESGRSAPSQARSSVGDIRSTALRCMPFTSRRVSLRTRFIVPSSITFGE